MAIDPRLVKIHEALEEFTRSGALDKAAAETAQPQPQPTSMTKVLDTESQFELHQKLIRKSTPELLAIFNDQAQHSEKGIPLATWLNNSGNPDAIFQAMQKNTPDAQLLTKAVDSAGAGALIRQDLEPVLTALFVKQFPAWERIQKVPANGLVHAWRQITSFGDAQFMPELGTVTDDNNTYLPQTTPVAILARRVGVSLKAQFAVTQGGAGWNLEQEELTGGLLAMAHKLQKTIFQGNAVDSGGTSSTESGAYDANGFTGLRYLLRNNADDIDLTTATPDDVTEGINAGVVTTTDAGGMPSVIYIRASEYNTWNNQQLPIVRIMDRNEFIPGVRVAGVATSAGDLPLVPIPGDSIGTYTYSGDTVADIYVVNESDLVMPYLGSPGITTLDIPIGVAGQLVHYFILFSMHGLALRTLLFSRKVRAKIA